MHALFPIDIQFGAMTYYLAQYRNTERELDKIAKFTELTNYRERFSVCMLIIGEI